MLAQYPVMQYLYTNFSLEIQYLPWWYDPKQLQTNCCFEGDVCVGLSGLWSGTKLWSSKYLEIDNFIVHPEHRKRNWQNANGLCRCKAKELSCTMIVLDAFTGNYTAHRFYYNQGYVPKGFIS
jgi:hypothetical protein